MNFNDCSKIEKNLAEHLLSDYVFFFFFDAFIFIFRNSFKVVTSKHSVNTHT